MKLLDFFMFRSDGRAAGMAAPRAQTLASASTTIKRGGITAGVLAVILGAVYVVEGGYVNNPNDPGGETRYGVTKTVARGFGYTGSMRLFPKHCDAEHPVCADLVYTTNYIERPGFMPLASIEPAVMEELVDSAVNFGPPRPSGWFQESLNELNNAGLVVDRKVGPASIAAYQKLQGRLGKTIACVMTLNKLDAKQRAEYDRLVRRNPRLRVFYKGWIRARIGNVDRAKCVAYQ